MANRTQIPFWILPLNLLLTLSVGVLGAKVWLLSSNQLPAEQMQAMRLVYHQITERYVDTPHTDDLMWSAVEGMVGDLDEHSEFIRPSHVEAFEEDTTGTYAGIGIVMASGIEPLTVKFPFAGGPAERAGLEVGDQIMAVDGEPLAADEPGELNDLARKRLLGPPATDVTLTIRRGDGEPFDQVLQRGDVYKPSVKWARIVDQANRIGYVYVAAFQPNTSSELLAAIDSMKDASGELSGLIIDLRFDRGGLLEQAISMANLFLDSGIIVSLKRRAQTMETHEADPAECHYPDLPLAVLINGGSASASEVVSGALQDHGRAVLVGERSFGKGVVQSIYRWEELDFRLKLTTAYYYTPSGRSIERVHRRPEDGDAKGGIAPDHRIEISDKDARAVLIGLSDHEVPARYRAAVTALSERLKLRVTAPLGPDADAQLAAAIEELRKSKR